MSVLMSPTIESELVRVGLVRLWMTTTKVDGGYLTRVHQRKHERSLGCVWAKTRTAAKRRALERARRRRRW